MMTSSTPSSQPHQAHLVDAQKQNNQIEKYEVKNATQTQKINTRFNVKCVPANTKISKALFIAPVNKLQEHLKQGKKNSHGFDDKDCYFGVYTTIDIDVDEEITIYVGKEEKVEEKGSSSTPQKKDAPHDIYTLNYYNEKSEKMIVDSVYHCNVARWLNGSVIANCKFEGKKVKAIRKINANEQLVIDYGTQYIFSRSRIFISPKDNWESLPQVFARKKDSYQAMTKSNLNNRIYSILNLEESHILYFPNITGASGNTDNVDDIIIITDSNGKILPQQPKITSLMAACMIGDIDNIRKLIPIATSGYECINGKTAFHYLYSSPYISDEDCNKMIDLWFKEKPEVIKDLIASLYKPVLHTIAESKIAQENRKLSSKTLATHVLNILKVPNTKISYKISDFSKDIDKHYKELNDLTEKFKLANKSSFSSRSSSSNAAQSNQEATETPSTKPKRKAQQTEKATTKKIKLTTAITKMDDDSPTERSENEALKRRVAELESNLQNKVQIEKEAETKISNLERKLAEAKKDAMDEREKRLIHGKAIEKLTSETQAQSASIDKLHGEKIQYMVNSSQNQVKLRNLRNKITSLNEEIAKKTAENNPSKTLLTQLTDQNKKLTTQLAQQEQTIASKTFTLNLCLDDVTRLNAQIIELGNQRKSDQENITRLNGKIIKLGNQQNPDQEEIKKLHKEIKKLTAQFAEEEEIKEKKNKRLTETHRVSLRLKKENELLKKQNNDLSNENTILQQQDTRAQHELMLLKNQIASVCYRFDDNRPKQTPSNETISNHSTSSQQQVIDLDAAKNIPPAPPSSLYPLPGTTMVSPSTSSSSSSASSSSTGNTALRFFPPPPAAKKTKVSELDEPPPLEPVDADCLEHSFN